MTASYRPWLLRLLSGSACVGVALTGCADSAEQARLDVTPIQTPAAPVSRTDGYYFSAVAAIERHDYPRALEALQAARQLAPSDVRVINAFGVVYDKLGRFDLSARYYAQAKALDANSPVVQANIAYSAVLSGAAHDEAGPLLAAAPAPPSPSTAPPPTAAPTTIAQTDAPPMAASPRLAEAPIEQRARVATAAPARAPSPSAPASVVSPPVKLPQVAALPSATKAPPAATTAAVPAPDRSPAMTARTVGPAPARIAQVAPVPLPAPARSAAAATVQAGPAPLSVLPIRGGSLPAASRIGSRPPVKVAPPQVAPTRPIIVAKAAASAPAPAAAVTSPAPAPKAAAVAATANPTPQSLSIPTVAPAAPQKRAPAGALAIAIAAKPAPIKSPPPNTPVSPAPLAVVAAPAPKVVSAPAQFAIVRPPLYIVNASGQTARGEPIRLALASKGWSTPVWALQQGPVQAHSVIHYPPSRRIVAVALAMTLPSRPQLSPCKCAGLRLVLGSDAKRWRPMPVAKARTRI